jgi:protoheme IX farnesyltransferase
LRLREAVLTAPERVWLDPADLLQLARPRLVALGLAVVALSYVMAAPGPRLADLALLLAGSGLALCGASALNQALERDPDRLMRRTAGRPVPAGRMSAPVAALCGLAATLAGLLLVSGGFGLLTATVTAAGWLLYVGVYTPLKRLTPLAIPIGAIPGATPALVGWSAADGTLGPAAWSLFAILVLWQLPHFLAIGWMYRADYSRAGLRLVPDGPDAGAAMGAKVLAYAAVLIPASLLPVAVGLTGAWWYPAAALLLGGAHLVAAARLARTRSGESARAMLRASVCYLPALLVLLALGARGGG